MSYGPPSARQKLSEEQKNKLQVFQGAVSSSGSYLNYLKETQCTLIGRVRKKSFPRPYIQSPPTPEVPIEVPPKAPEVYRPLALALHKGPN